MERRIVLIKAPPSRSSDIAEQLSGVPGVNHVFVVEGEYQLVAMVTGKGPEDLAALLDRHIASVEGVEIARLLTALRQFSHDEVNSEMIGFGP